MNQVTGRRKCKKIKFSKRKVAERSATHLTEKYGMPMCAYKCKKCVGAPWHVGNLLPYALGWSATRRGNGRKRNNPGLQDGRRAD